MPERSPNRNWTTALKWLLQLGDDIVGTGGILYHYNRPYGDIFMAIGESSRRKGLGAFLVQELKANLLRKRKHPRRALQRGQHPLPASPSRKPASSPAETS